MRARNYVLGMLVPWSVFVALGLFATLSPGASELIPLLPVIAIPAAIAPAVLVYRMWAAIRDDQTKLSPGMALFGLMVPVLNLFWAFRVWGLWPVEYGAFAERAQKEVPSIGRAPFITMLVAGFGAPILAAIGLQMWNMRLAPDTGIMLVIVATLSALLGSVLFFVVLGRVCSGVNRLTAA